MVGDEAADLHGAGSLTWSGNAQIPWRDTYDMAEHLPVSKRIPYTSLQPGDILFWIAARQTA